MSRSRRTATILAHAGRDPGANHGMVNPPVYHTSTVIWPTVAAMDAAHTGFEHGVYSYGRVGTPTSEAFEDVVTALEGGYGSIAVSSGLAAVNVAMTAFVKAGDHILVTDSIYGPGRRYGDAVLSRFGVEVEYYDPLIGAGIESLFRDNTRLVYLESPGSLTFEVQDVPAITAAARAQGILSVLDNTWATPLYFDAFAHGIDVTVHAATKYMVGHSDAMMGIVGAREKSVWSQLKTFAVQAGHCAGPDDLYLAQRGLRTMGVRLRQHQDNGLEVARWLQARPEVSRVLHPALPQDPGHTMWKRDFTGASGLFSFVLKPAAKAQVDAMLDGMELFQMGASWGGYESLITPIQPEKIRTATHWQAEGPGIRLHVGLEDTGDLIADLEAGFDRLRAGA